MEDQEQWLVTTLALQLFTSEFLVLAQQFRSEDDVSGLVDTVDVTEGGGDGEVGGDGGQGLVDVEDFVWLGVQGVVVGTSVVDTVLLTTGQADFHFEPFCGRGSVRTQSMKDMYSRFILAIRVKYLTQVAMFSSLDSSDKSIMWELQTLVRAYSRWVAACYSREQGNTVLLEVGLVGVQHAIEPRQELLGTVVGVHNDGDTVGRSDSSNKVGSSDGTGDGSLLLFSAVLDTLAGPEGGTTLGNLQDDGRLQVSSGFHGSVGGGRRGDVEGGDGIVVLPGVFEQLSGLVTGQNAGLMDQKWSQRTRSTISLLASPRLLLTGTISKAPILIVVCWF